MAQGARAVSRENSIETACVICVDENKPLWLCRKPGVRCRGRRANNLLRLRYDGPAEHAFEARTGESHFWHLWERREGSGGLVGGHGRHPQGWYMAYGIIQYMVVDIGQITISCR